MRSRRRWCLPAASLSLLVVFLSCSPVQSRKHHLEIRTDGRRYFPISTFGFFTGGFLRVNVTAFRTTGGKGEGPLGPLGFSIDKTANDAINPYVETSEAR